MTQPAGHEGPLAEFAALRQEMDMKIQNQYQLLTLQLTLTGAIFSFAISRAGLAGLLLIVPVSTYLLCGRWASQHHGIHRIGTYIQQELSQRVPGGLGWEAWTRDNPRKGRLLGMTVPMFLTFPGAALLSLAWSFGYIFLGQQGAAARTGLVLIWVLGLLAAALSAALVLEVAGRPAGGRPLAG